MNLSLYQSYLILYNVAEADDHLFSILDETQTSSAKGTDSQLPPKVGICLRYSRTMALTPLLLCSLHIE